MTVLRVVANIAAEDTSEATSFYRDLLGLEVIMDLGWIATYSSGETMSAQLSVATQGGSGTQVPDLSIEVDNVDEIYERAITADLEIIYRITDEPWNARRFYVRDPLGKVINVLQHIKD